MKLATARPAEIKKLPLRTQMEAFLFLPDAASLLALLFFLLDFLDGLFLFQGLGRLFLDRFLTVLGFTHDRFSKLDK